MKKKIFKLLTGMLLSCALAGSTVAVQAEEAGTDTVKSYLTGEDVSVGIGHRRPIAVMLGNDTNGAPQSGTGLGRNIGAKTHGGKHVNTFNIPLRLILGTT